ncbi:D-isomer specific 2-hydroxyacid dehydrogenase [Alternaria rosae]|uniref:D-isomer specific 2-hydroxyacid dehydrogenase n=1 Tax=Alternaria rosae TaxID=1187941 RepID=UPI001E8CEA6D|nr:D-isomer specific 2-hydroxyacid dehydrogenase [Alternaria rosae]KAH6875103.1 D-isomer specific 2-hydroxyacid dehydrogenase [Alternaria rosae]
MAPALIEPETDLPSSTSSNGANKATVYLLDTLHPQAMESAQSLFNAITPSDPRHSDWKEKAEYLVIRGSYLTAEDIAACKNLKAIGKQGVGIDKIDGEACRARGIKIFNTPGVNAQAVAETVLSLTMSVAREVSRIIALQSAGFSVPKETCSGLIINKKMIGIIGMGNIGRKVAQIFQGGLGCRIIAYDPLLPKDAWEDIAHTRAETLEEVLRASDIVTLHIPLIPQTRGLISYQQFKIMKPTSILINTARGGIVHEADLERALREGLIWGAGLDCHEHEPPTKEIYGSLWDTGRVVSTPHVGAATAETQMETAMAAVDRLHDYIQTVRVL